MLEIWPGGLFKFSSCIAILLLSSLPSVGGLTEAVIRGMKRRTSWGFMLEWKTWREVGDVRVVVGEVRSGMNSPGMRSLLLYIYFVEYTV